MNFLTLFAACAFAAGAAEPALKTLPYATFTGTATVEGFAGVYAPFGGRITEVAVSSGARVEKGELLAELASEEMAAVLAAARSKKKAVEEWGSHYKYQEIRSPSPALVSAVDAKKGLTVSEGDRLFLLAEKFYVSAGTTCGLYAPLAEGMEARLTSRAGIEARGTLRHFTRIGETGVWQLLIELVSPPKDLRAGDVFFGSVLGPAKKER